MKETRADEGGSHLQNRSQNRAQPPRRPLLSHITATRRKSLPRLPTRLLLRRCIHCSPARIFHHHHQEHQLRRSRRPPRPPGSILRLSPVPLRRSQLYPSEPSSSQQQHPPTPTMGHRFPVALPHASLATKNNSPGFPHARASHRGPRNPRISTYAGQPSGEKREEYRGLGVGFIGTVSRSRADGK